MTTTTMNREVDLLILGGGAGGLAAALAGALMGLKVLVCEKTDQIGGTASTSAGTLWIPENTQSVKQGHGDTRRAAQDYLAQLINDPASDPLREAFLQTGPEAIDFSRTIQRYSFWHVASTRTIWIFRVLPWWAGPLCLYLSMAAC